MIEPVITALGVEIHANPQHAHPFHTHSCSLTRRLCFCSQRQISIDVLRVLSPSFPSVIIFSFIHFLNPRVLSSLQIIIFASPETARNNLFSCRFSEKIFKLFIFLE